MVLLVQLLDRQKATTKDLEQLGELLLEDHSLQDELLAAVEVL